MTRHIINIAIVVILMSVPPVLVTAWSMAASARLSAAETAEKAAPDEIALAQEANEAYCTADLKKILRRCSKAAASSEDAPVGAVNPSTPRASPP